MRFTNRAGSLSLNHVEIAPTLSCKVVKQLLVVHVFLYFSQPVTKENVAAISRWVEVLSQSSKSFEKTDDVRLAVANSLLANFSVYISKNEDLSKLLLA